MKVSKILSFRKRVVVIVIGALLGGLSLLYTNNLAFRLKEKEQHDVALWAHAMERLNRDVLGGTIQVEDPLVDDLISS
ncbi:MAG: sensor histidine kinase, partial [Alistipes sp.]|nr:sensor histidine kinase [Alistipes sp.]